MVTFWFIALLSAFRLCGVWSLLFYAVNRTVKSLIETIAQLLDRPPDQSEHCVLKLCNSEEYFKK